MNKNVRITFLLDPYEEIVLNKMIEMSGLKKSEYLRKLIIEDWKKYNEINEEN